MYRGTSQERIEPRQDADRESHLQPKRVMVISWGSQVRWGNGLDLPGLGFPICKVDVVLRRLRQCRTLPRAWGLVCAQEMLGALMIIIVIIVVVVWQPESTLAGHRSQLASVIWEMFWSANPA